MYVYDTQMGDSSVDVDLLDDDTVGMLIIALARGQEKFEAADVEAVASWANNIRIGGAALEMVQKGTATLRVENGDVKIGVAQPDDYFARAMAALSQSKGQEGVER